MMKKSINLGFYGNVFVGGRAYDHRLSITTHDDYLIYVLLRVLIETSVVEFYIKSTTTIYLNVIDEY